MKFKSFKMVKIFLMITNKSLAHSNKFFIKKLYFATLISVSSALMRKGKDPDPYCG